jgi:transcriptional regulator with XRE-family HTH domain
LASKRKKIYGDKVFGENLTRLLEQKGLRKLDLANALGITPGYVSLLCAGKRHPYLDLACEAASLLDVPLSELCGLSNSPETKAKETPLSSEEAALVLVARSIGVSKLLNHCLTCPTFRELREWGKGENK